MINNFYLFCLEDIAKIPFCQVNLNDEKLKAFIYAVRNHYWYQMYIDDLPIWGKLYFLNVYSLYFNFNCNKIVLYVRHCWRIR